MHVSFISLHQLTVFFILTFFLFLPCSKPVSDYSTLVYKTCANQTFADDPLSPQSYSQTLTSLFQQLIAQSSHFKFFKTKQLVSINDDTAISGLFQCRDDISTQDCFTCVNLLPQMSITLCRYSVSARVQLEGCYIQYETEKLRAETTTTTTSTGGESDESSDIPTLLHKDCGEPTMSTVEYAKFRELMDAAFVALESGIVNGNGYFRTNFESVELMAQCEGDSGACECSECVSDAVQFAREQCGSSISAQIYLDKCFMSYIYHPESSGTNKNSSTEKLAAIIVGGAAVVLLAFIFFSVLKSRFKKDDYE